MAAAHCGSSPRRSRLVKGKWVPRCTLSCSGLPGSCGSAPLFRTRRLLADRGAHIGGIAGVRPRRTSLGCRAHCSIAYFFQLAHPVFPVFGLGCVDGLLPERVLRPACTSVLLIFYFYPFRLLTVTGFSCQSAACRWAVSSGRDSLWRQFSVHLGLCTVPASAHSGWSGLEIFQFALNLHSR